MFKRSIFILIFSLMVVAQVVVAQSTSVASSKNFVGSFKDGVYRNDFFGFRMTIPTDLHVTSDEERKAAVQGGAKMISADIDGDKAAFEKAATAEIMVFGATEAKPGQTGNASLLVGVLKQGDGVTSRMVANKARSLLLQNPRFNVTKDTSLVSVGGADFSLIEMEADTGSYVLKFKYYATVRRGYSLTFTITYLNRESLERFQKVLDTLAFDQK
jgi:hypothetical protein